MLYITDTSVTYSIALYCLIYTYVVYYTEIKQLTSEIIVEITPYRYGE
jgi:hypothetical protein